MQGSGYERPGTSVVTWLMCAMVAGFIIQMMVQTWIGPGAGQAFTRGLGLTVEGLSSGHLWTLVTYAFLHSPGNFFHIIGNLLGLFFLGRELLPYLGSRRFLVLFFSAVISGGLLWAITHWSYGGAVIGASAGVVSLLVVFACLNPNQPITLLLFFILPVTLKPKWIAIGLLAIDLGGFLFYEALGNNSPMGFAHSAHLGGMAIGWIYYRYVHAREWKRPDQRAPVVELPRWFKQARKTSTPPPAYRVNVTNREDLRAEVDRILDKINSEGFGSLTPEEKRLLDDARDSLSRR